MDLNYICNHRYESINHMCMFSSDFLSEQDIERIKTTYRFVDIEDIIDRFRGIDYNDRRNKEYAERMCMCLRYLYVVVHDNKDMHILSCTKSDDDQSRCNTPIVMVEH